MACDVWCVCWVVCGVWGVGCGVWGVGSGVWGVGCGVWDVGCGEVEGEGIFFVPHPSEWGCAKLSDIRLLLLLLLFHDLLSPIYPTDSAPDYRDSLQSSSGFLPCNVQCTLYNVQCTMCIAQCTMGTRSI